MVALYTVTPPIGDKKRRQRIYDGALIVFKSVDALRELCDFTDKMIRSAFSTEDPTTAHESMERDPYLEVVDRLQKKFTNDGHVRDLLKEALHQCGVALTSTYWTWPPLRLIPPDGVHVGRQTSGLGVHRDSWHTNLYSETNWWLPIYPLEYGRSIAIYPSYWDQKVENTSDGWNLDKFRAARRRVTDRNGSFEELRSAYPPPQATDPPDPRNEVRIILEPGDVLNFSLNHLHLGAPNTTAHTRFSCDIRTIHFDDCLDSVGSPNIDSGSSTKAAKEDFVSVEHGETLSQALKEQGIDG